jgi:antitoxin component YwqK of YwqJK toxin-antitoxin module
MQLFSYRVQVFFLLALIAVGTYTLISISYSGNEFGSVVTKDGLIVNQTTSKPFTGRVVDTVANQVVSYEVINGIKNGEFIINYLDGTKAVDGNIINNKNEGKWSYYYLTGELESEGYFKNDIASDEWTWYYPNGNKMEEGLFIKGKRDGKWKLYNENGSLKSTVIFNEGNVVTSFNEKSPMAS